MIRSLLKAAICVPLFAQLASAQAETPEAVVEQLMAATKANDWARVVALTHPSALHQVRILLDPILTTDGAALDTARQLMFGFASRTAAAAASDSAVMLGVIRFAMSQQPKAADALRSSSYRLLGLVHEGPDTVHVVTRISMSFGGSSGNQIEVTSLIRSGPTWRALLKGDWTQMATRLRAAILQGPGP
jgi:hypothetical protein